MANSLTNYGQTIALNEDDRSESGITGTTTNTGGIKKMAVELHLYTSASTPHKEHDSATWVEASGGGYAAKTGLAGSWTVQITSGNVEIQLVDQTWTASGGSIANVAGAFASDADDNPIAWWERSSAITLNDGDSITADDLIIRLT